MNNFFPDPLFKVDVLSGFIALAIGLFTTLVIVYSLKFKQGPGLFKYYTYIILTAIAAVLAVLANNLILLLVFWGFLGLTLYLLILLGDQDSPLVAKKALIIVGGSDALMTLGIGIIYYFSQSLQMNQIRLELNNGLLILAYICIALGCFAKAGAMPLHSWIPGCAKSAPIPVVAYLPASLDKLLGIYLLIRASLGLFVMNKSMNIFLMSIGAITIVAAVMMALVQHNLKKLLGYHAVSQVGYMVLGIGTGNPIGIAGGLFHMLNHAVYKSCLFLSAGNVEYRTNTTELKELGGLAKWMPITYIAFMIASFSISGIPPFNGFVSKWMIYQGLFINIAQARGSAQSIFSVFCLVAAMFGSALTLASFMKLLHAVFMGQRLDTAKNGQIKEAPATMWWPCVILAAICVIFGVFAFILPLKYFVLPVIKEYLPIENGLLLGVWLPVPATLLMLLGLLAGFLIYKFGKFQLLLRRDAAFVGGEPGAIQNENAVTGVDFYNSVQEIGVLRFFYKKAQSGVFDIYEQSKKVFMISRILQLLHNGVLPTYLVWVLLGAIGLFFALMR